MPATKRDIVVFAIASIVAISSATVLFNTIEVAPKPAQSAPVNEAMDFTDACLMMFDEAPNYLEYTLRVDREWWKDGQKVYLFNRWNRKGERDTRVCVVDIDKGFVFSPPAISQHQYY